MSDAMPNPVQSPAHKAAKLAVIILSVLIILALIALVAGAILKLAGKGPSAAQPLASGTVFALPPGSKLVSMDSQPGRLILRVRTDAGEEVEILDTATGHLISQVKVPAGK